MPYALDRLNSATESEETCPFLEKACVCRAAFSGLAVSPDRARQYCTVEDHDLCPLFLSKVLRSSQPRYCGSLRNDFAHK